MKEWKTHFQIEEILAMILSFLYCYSIFIRSTIDTSPSYLSASTCPPSFCHFLKLFTGRFLLFVCLWNIDKKNLKVQWRKSFLNSYVHSVLYIWFIQTIINILQVFCWSVYSILLSTGKIFWSWDFNYQLLMPWRNI